jgi:hypothetical protein
LLIFFCEIEKYILLVFLVFSTVFGYLAIMINNSGKYMLFDIHNEVAYIRRQNFTKFKIFLNKYQTDNYWYITE